jgi:hypothetical protein
MRGRCFLMHTVLLACFAFASAYSQPQKPAADTVSARLTAAKKVLVTRARGSIIPYDVIKSTLDGWGRFTIVESPDQADLVVQVSTTGDNSLSVSSSSNNLASGGGGLDRSGRSSRDVSPSDITMTVYDAKSKRVLWIATETAKSAVKEKARENNLVEAAERLTSRFHDRVEPPPPKDTN